MPQGGRTCTVRTQITNGPSSLVGEIRAVPPTATKGLKERRGVSVAVGFGLDKIDGTLLVGLFGVQKRQIAGVTGLELLSGQFERGLGAVTRRRGGA